MHGVSDGLNNRICRGFSNTDVITWIKAIANPAFADNNHTTRPPISKHQAKRTRDSQTMKLTLLFTLIIAALFGLVCCEDKPVAANTNEAATNPPAVEDVDADAEAEQYGRHGGGGYRGGRYGGHYGGGYGRHHGGYGGGGRGRSY
ncbi:hypothetical protein SeLEV6574_g01367 [Synchytrium endobioticum]|uniref:Uncharacterized protein n=2 Tax=Synchytrium endobioticum TaxID=286115 RepID=A0A507DDQ0_9FUNG|nr:hypothetical protein SeLEV6574_g01367 [Synchytrium endobioticum]